ncbi:MAG: hypothetical protein MZV63_33425 [Marinilabiliales bacterium]|nr:hypothetical protein [Marinilabiliales bacterium]
MHESQSRLWENLVGRSRGFWASLLPAARRPRFPQAAGGRADSEAFYRAINKVRALARPRRGRRGHLQPARHASASSWSWTCSRARSASTDAARRLARALSRRTSASRRPTTATASLQDVHWYARLDRRTFQGYTLGNILMRAVLRPRPSRTRPGIPAEIARGEFGALHGWLRENVYRHGAQVHRPTSCVRARDRRAAAHRALPRLPVAQVPAALRAAG